MWWNMDPITPMGTIAPFESPRHGFPLIAGGMLKPVSSLAYVDDAKRYVALLKSQHKIEEFFTFVQAYCDLLADLSLVIKMGQNVNKCTIYLYNIPEDVEIPEFTSIAWSYDSQGPVRGTITTVVLRRNITNDHLICYDIPPTIRSEAPEHIKLALKPRKYLGVPTNAQLDTTEGKEKMLTKLTQRILLISTKAECIQEAMISHNMLVCQVATYSPLCIPMSIQECTNIDKSLLKAYQYKLQFMQHDAKHSIFISLKRGGFGLKSFTREYTSALLRDTEVYISNEASLPAHALLSSLPMEPTSRRQNPSDTSRHSAQGTTI